MTHVLKYRPHIDGLRAVAVLSVLFYHVGVPWPRGGFAGVDIFFVISGFLISRIIYSEVRDGQFSIVSFYERRAKRILPAFFVITALTAIAVYLLFLPSELEGFSKSVLSAVLFSANNYFYATADYFSPDAHSLPLLHYWSLGVEEQFYLIFPLILVALVRLQRLRLSAAIIAIFATSLAVSEIVVRAGQSACCLLSAPISRV